MKKSQVMALLIALALLGVSCARKDASESSNSDSKGASATSDRSSKSAQVKEAPASDHDFKYDLTKDGTGIEITGYTGNHDNLVIPKTIEGYPVKFVGRISNGEYIPNSNPLYAGHTRNDTSKTQTVVIPEGVELIGYEAFYSMPSLRKVVLPNTVSIISDSAFYRCYSLSEINIPAGIKKIYGTAFRGCENLYVLHIPESITSIEFIDSDQFSGCQKLSIATRQRLKDLGYKGTF